MKALRNKTRKDTQPKCQVMAVLDLLYGCKVDINKVRIAKQIFFFDTWIRHLPVPSSDTFSSFSWMS